MIQSMINAIEKPAIFIDHNYVIKAVNNAYSNHYHTSVLVNKSKCYQISHQANSPCDQHGEDCPLKTCKNSHKAQRVLHVHNNGNLKEYCDILMQPVIDDNGITIGFLEILDQVNYASYHAEKDKLIGTSSAFKKMLALVNRCAKSDISVLLHGETGTGKELVANAIHQASARKNKPFVVLECTGLTETLFESELFGHEKGAFTGATTSKKGLVDLAHGGTLFLDEVGDIPLSLQVKLLRLLETGTYRSVGGMEVKKTDFRLICASHKNLSYMVSDNTFRQDLYYRIAAFPIYLPQLKQRQEDIPLLANHYLSQSEFHHKTFTNEALTALMLYSFPGNIRELKNIIDRAVLMNDDNEITVNCLGLEDSTTANNIALTAANNTLSLMELEKLYLQMLCCNNQQSVEQIANSLGISKRTLYRKLQHHQISITKL